MTKDELVVELNGEAHQKHDGLHDGPSQKAEKTS
jgi:hypothetical protein